MTETSGKPRRTQTVRTVQRTRQQQAGSAAESQAQAYLEVQGLKTLAQNFRCRFGEIDLIMQDGTTLAFVEVRQRKARHFGGAAASVTKSKQDRLLATAQVFLQRYKALPACRFDVVAIEGQAIQWLKNVIES